MVEERVPLGAHVSTAGGVDRAWQRAAALGCGAVQVFVKSPNQWRLPDLPEQAARRFDELRGADLQQDTPLRWVAHAAYLINLASPEPALWERSCEGLLSEWRRCWRLGIEALVVHPGSHRGWTLDEGVRRVRSALEGLLEEVDSLAGQFGSPPPRLLLENTAGGGAQLGVTVEQLAAMVDSFPETIGVCLDTCHAWAAGYDLRPADGWASLLDTFDRQVGIDRLGCVHLNDSVHGCGSRRDRHANIGEGLIGSRAFGRVVRSVATLAVPMVLETPSGELTGDPPRPEGHARDLERLRKMLRRASS